MAPWSTLHTVLYTLHTEGRAPMPLLPRPGWKVYRTYQHIPVSLTTKCARPEHMAGSIARISMHRLTQARLSFRLTNASTHIAHMSSCLESKPVRLKA